MTTTNQPAPHEHVDQHPTTVPLTEDGEIQSRPQSIRPPRRFRRPRVALAATGVVALAALGLAWAGTGSSYHTAPANRALADTVDSKQTVQPASICDLGNGGVSVLAAALDACLIRTGPFSLISAIAFPTSTS